MGLRDTVNFVQLLSGHRRGTLLASADERLKEVVKAVRETGLAGEVTVTIPLKLNKAGQLEITPTVKAKIPTKPLGTGIYFATDDDLLTRSDPMQTDIEDELGSARERDSVN